MSDRTFSVSSVEDAERLQARLRDYRRRKFGDDHDRLPSGYLGHLYTYCRNHQPDGRLFVAILDLEFTYLSMQRDLLEHAGIWNLQFAPPRVLPDDVLDNPDHFTAKIDILHATTGFAVRCRAFWDKAIGILFLLYDQPSYQSFVKADKRVRFFRRQAAKWPPISAHLANALNKVNVDELRSEPGIPDHSMRPAFQAYQGPDSPFPEHLAEIIDTLDEVRTAEVHGTGVLRKWSLAMLQPHESKDAWLINHWNIANGYIRALRHELLEQAGHPRESR